MPENLHKSKGYRCPIQLSWQPPEPTKRHNLLVSFFEKDGTRFCNVGTIGHVEWPLKSLAAAIIYNLPAVRHKLKRNNWHTHNVFG